ncbi:hypothetical protein [Noviherbaspirillum sedimenti]|uniref:hypothetical protein n=1 Tax=Noviherbaspirillum sedimenti TaxID=2320865 RepID=UPI0011C3CA51|nr:hypothetical protein [Noviherbaspirillum sedimenti]
MSVSVASNIKARALPAFAISNAMAIAKTMPVRYLIDFVGIFTLSDRGAAKCEENAGKVVQCENNSSVIVFKALIIMDNSCSTNEQLIIY